MKVTLSTILLVGTATLALAHPEPEAKKAKGVITRCTVPGMACGKRTADPDPEAKKAKGVITRCTAPGIACGKREADALLLPGYSTKREAEAEAEAKQAKGVITRCTVPGIACGKRDAEAGQAAFCGLPGEACSRAKRSALAIADAFAEADPDQTGLCGVAGQPCAKARRSINDVGIAAEHVYNTVSAAEKRYVSYHTYDEKAKRWEPPTCGVRGFSCSLARDQLMWEHKRYAEAKKAKGVITRCTDPGMACGKRDYDEVSLEARTAEAIAEAKKAKGVITRCTVPGMACGKREAEAEAAKGRITQCTVPGMACGRKRDAEAEAKKAKGVITRCTVPGMACGKRDADAEPKKAKGVITRCTVPGIACGKRDAEPEAYAEAEAIAEAEAKKAKGVITRCTAPGIACGRKRDAEAIAKKAKGVITRCTVPGMACGKREAEAEAKRAKGVITRCTVPGMACGKRDMEAEHALESRCGVRGYSCPLAREAGKAKGVITRCTTPGIACGKRLSDDEAAELEARDAEAEPEAKKKSKKAKGVITRCTVPGMACGKREAEAEAEATKAKGVITRCTAPGIACGRRDAEAERTLRIAMMEERDSGLDAETEMLAKRCGIFGMSCTRDAEDSLHIDHNDDQNGFCGVNGEDCATTLRRNAEPKKAKGVITRCTVPGMACGKRDLVTNGDDTTEEEGLVNQITEANPDYFQTDCDKQGGECHAIAKAHRLFMEAKREAEQAASHTTDLVARAAFCDTHDCTYATRRWVEEAANQADDAFDEYEDCHAEDGDCTVVKRALDELEEKLEAAVAAL